MILLQLLIAALVACLPAVVTFAFVLLRAGWVQTEAAGVIAMAALIYAALAWLATFIGLGLLLLVIG